MRIVKLVTRCGCSRLVVIYEGAHRWVVPLPSSARWYSRGDDFVDGTPVKLEKRQFIDTGRKSDEGYSVYEEEVGE